MTISEAPAVHARTTDVPEAERFDYFRDALSEVYLGIRTEWTGSGPFDASYDAYPVGGDVLAHMSAPGCVGRRGAALVTQRPDDAVYLNLSLSAPNVVHHLDRSWTLGRGMPILLDSEAPFVVDFADRPRFRLMTLRLAKGAGFAPNATAVRRIDERIARTATGRALAAQTRLLCAELEAGRPEVATAMVAPVRLLGVLAGTPQDARPRLDDVKAVARRRLADPELRAEHLGVVFGVSGRTIQADFAAAGESFAAWLLAERLDLAHERLGAAAWRTRSIAAVATACGFRDATHFHRAFRGRFGTTPGAVRADR